jgi:hypothetical protein
MTEPSRAATRLLLLVAACSLGCTAEIEFTTPGRVPPEAGDFVIEVDGVERGFGPAQLVRAGADEPTIFARIGSQSSAEITLPAEASTVSCADRPKAIVLTTSSPLEHTDTSFKEATWSATDCSITVSRIDATATQGAEGSFSGTLVRDRDEVGGEEIVGPKTLVVQATFIVAN